MELTHTILLAVPVDRAWAVLEDPEVVARCLPGATLIERDGDTSRGTLSLKLGPISATYEGTLTVLSRDEQAGKVVLRATGVEQDAAGALDATIEVALVADRGRTIVNVTSELDISGRVAQFGRGVVVDVGARLLDGLVRQLERTELAGELVFAPVEEPESKPEPDPDAEPPAEPEARESRRRRRRRDRAKETSVAAEEPEGPDSVSSLPPPPPPPTREDRVEVPDSEVPDSEVEAIIAWSVEPLPEIEEPVLAWEPPPLPEPEPEPAPEPEPEPAPEPEPEPAPVSAISRPIDVPRPAPRSVEDSVAQKAAPYVALLILLWILRRMFGSSDE